MLPHTLNTFEIQKRLPSKLERELNFARCSRSRGQQSRSSGGATARVEDVQFSHRRRGKVGVIHDVEYFHPELLVEGFRNLLERIVLEQRKIEVGEARSIQNVAAGGSRQVKTP